MSKVAEPIRTTAYKPHPIARDIQYFPFLLNLVTEGKYDPSFVFTHKDKFENIAQGYKDSNNHQVPGGLKICLETAFGRAQVVKS